MGKLDRFLKGLVTTVSCAAVAVQPVLAQSITGDGGVNAPQVLTSANGTPLVQITTPDAQGVSHNTYGQFDVGTAGVILNNADSNYQLTNLAGYVQGNSNLANGPASLILNEVTSTDPSEIEGYIEVAGAQATVVVANPYGITCDGCGFINTDHVGLTTGTPTYGDGGFEGFRVDQGAIVIGRGGADARGVSQFDLIARNVVFDGSVQGQRVTVIAGRNDVVFATGATTVRPADGSEGAELAIDSTVFGGMYADKITIVSTERGAGVRAPETMSAGAGGMRITADGRLVMGTATSEGRVQAQAETVTVTRRVHSREPISLEARQQMILEADAQIVSDASASVQAGTDMTLGDGSVIYANGALSVEARNLLHLGENAALTSWSDMGITAGAAQLEPGANVITGADNPEGVPGTGTLSFSVTGDADIQGATVFATGALVFDAAAVTIDADPALPVSSFASLAPMSISAEVLDARGTMFRSAGSLSLSADGRLSLTDGSHVAAQSALDLSAGEVHLTGVLIESLDSIGVAAEQEIMATDAALVAAGSVTAVSDTGNSIWQGASVIGNTGAAQIVALSGDVVFEGTVAGSQAVSLSAAGTVSVTGQVESHTDILLTGQVTDLQGGAVAGGRILALAEQDLTVTGDLISGEPLSLKAQSGTLSTTGTLQSVGAVVLRAGLSLDNKASLTSLGITSVISGGDLTNAGAVLARSGIALGAATALTNSGTLTTGGGIVLEAGTLLTNTGSGGGGDAADAQLLVLSAAEIVNSGDLDVTGGITVEATAGSVLNTGHLYAGGSVDLTAVGQIVQRGTLLSPGDITLLGSAVDQGGVVQSAGAVSVLALDGSVVQSGLVIGDAAVTYLAQRSFTHSGVTRSSGAGGIALAAGQADLGGEIITQQALNAVVSGPLSVTGVLSGQTVRMEADTYDQSGTVIGSDSVTVITETGGLEMTGTILSNGLVVLDSATTLSLGGQIQSNSLALAGADILNTTNLAVSGVLILQAGNTLVNQGGLAAGQDLTLLAGGDLTNRGTLLTGGALQLIAGGVVNNSGSGGGEGVADAQTLVFAGSDIINTGDFDVVQFVSMQAGTGSLQTTGALAAGGRMDLWAAGGLSNEGSLVAQTAVALEGGTVTNSTTGRIQTGGDALLSATAGDLLQAGLVTGDISVTYLSASTLTQTGITQSAGTGGVYASAQAATIGGAVATNGDLVINITDAFSVTGQMTGAQVDLQAGRYTQTGSVVGLNGISILSKAGDARVAGNLLSNGAISLTGIGGVETSALIRAGGDITLSGADLMLQSDILSEGFVTLAASGALTNTGALVGGYGLTLTSGTDQTNSGTLLTAGPLTLTAGGALVNTGSGGGAGGADAASLVVTGASVENSGSFRIAGQVDLTAQTGALINRGQVVAGQGLTFTSVAGALTNTGDLLATGSVALSAAGRLENGGNVQTAGDLDITGGQLLTTGALLANGDLRLTSTVGNLRNEGAVVSSGPLQFVSAAALITTGAVTSGTLIDLTAAQNLTQSGAFLSNGTVTMTAGDALVNTGSGAAVDQASALAVIMTGASVENSGSFIAAQDIRLTGTAGPVSTSGVLQAGGSIEVDATGAAQISGSLTALNSVTVNGSAITTAGSVAALGSVTLTAGAAGIMQGAVIDANQAIVVTSAGQFEQGATARLRSALSDVTIEAATGVVDGAILAGGDVTLTTSGALSLPGTVYSGDTLTADAAALTISGQLTAVTGLEAVARTGALDLQGAIASNGQITLTAAQALTTGTGSQITSSAGDIVLTASTATTNSAVGAVLAGQVLTHNTVSVTANSLRVSGELGSGAGITLAALNGDLTIFGTLTTSLLTATTSGALTNSGSISANILASAGGDFVNTGRILSRAADITGLSITNGATGQINLSDATVASVLTATGAVQNDGSLSAAGSLAVNAGTTLANPGQIDAAGTLLVQTADITNATGAVMEGGSVVLLADSLTNAGTLRSDTTLLADLEVSLTNTGVIQSGDTLQITAPGFTNVGEIKAFGGALSVGEVTSFDNTGGTLYSDIGIFVETSDSLTYGDAIWGRISEEGSLSLAGINGGYLPGFTINAGETLATTGDLLIRAGAVTVAGTLASATGNLVLQSATDITNTGLIYAGGDWLMLRAGGDVLNDGGALLANTNLAICGVSTDNCLANLSTDWATSLTNTNGGTIETFTGDIYLAAETILNGVVVGTPSYEKYFEIAGVRYEYDYAMGELEAWMEREFGERYTNGEIELTEDLFVVFIRRRNGVYELADKIHISTALADVFGAIYPIRSFDSDVVDSLIDSEFKLESEHSYYVYKNQTTHRPINSFTDTYLIERDGIDGNGIVYGSTIRSANNTTIIATDIDNVESVISAASNLEITSSSLRNIEAGGFERTSRYFDEHDFDNRDRYSEIWHETVTVETVLTTVDGITTIEAGGTITGSVDTYLNYASISDNLTTLTATSSAVPTVTPAVVSATEDATSAFTAAVRDSFLGAPGAGSADLSTVSSLLNTTVADGSTGTVSTGNLLTGQVDMTGLSGTEIDTAASPVLTAFGGLSNTQVDALSAGFASLSGATTPVSVSQLQIEPSSVQLTPTMPQSDIVGTVDIAAISQDQLFSVNPDPLSGYLVETAHEFVNLDAFLSSDYFLGSLNFDPGITQKRLGDALVETYLIRNQLYELTGSNILHSDLSEKEQMRALYDNAIDAAEYLDLVPGVALTPAQIASLTDDVIWLEERVVSGETVLVPQVYLASSGTAAFSGAQIKAGGSISLDVGSLSNIGGTLSAGDQLAINAANDIFNQGGVLAAGGNVDLSALSGDITNLSGLISGDDVALTAGSINIQTDVFEFGTGGNSVIDMAGPQSTVQATGTLDLVAIDATTITGADLTAGSDLSLFAGNDIEIGVTALTRSHQGSGFEAFSTTGLSSTLSSDTGDLTITSASFDQNGALVGGGNIALQAASLSAGGRIDLAAYTGSVALTGFAETDYTYTSSTSRGLLGRSTTTTERLDVTWLTNDLTADEINIYGAGTVYDQASDLTAKTGHLALASGYGDVVFDSVSEVHAYNSTSDSSVLFGMFSSSSEVASLKTTALSVNANAGQDIDLVSAGDLIIEGGAFTAGGRISTDVAGATTLLGTVDTDYYSGTFNRNTGFTITDTTVVDITQSAGFTALDGASVDLDPASAVTVGLAQDQAAVGSYARSLLAPGAEGAGAMTLLEYYLPDPTAPPGADPLTAAIAGILNAPSTGDGGGGSNPAHDLSNSYVEVGLPTAGDGAGYAYLDTLLSADRLTVEEMQLLQHHYYDQQVQLGPLGQLLVNYLTSAIIPGSGIVAAMQKVVVSGLLEGVITGELDVNALLKDIAFAGVSNWATGSIDLNALGIEGLSADSYLGMGEQFSEANLAEGLLDTAITSGLSSVAYGTDFTETFLNNYASFAVMAATADLQTGIGDWAFRTDQVGSFAHYGRHALTGCVAGGLLGGDCVSAAVGAVAGEGYGLVTGDTNSNTAYLVAGLAAAITSGGDTTATLTAASLGQSAFENNYLTISQWASLNDALQDCGENESCITRVFNTYESLSQDQNSAFYACIAAGDAECVQSVLNDLRELDHQYSEAVSIINASEKLGLGVSDFEPLLGFDTDGYRTGQIISFNPGNYDGSLLDAYNNFAQAVCREKPQGCTEEFSRLRYELQQQGIADLAIFGSAIFAAPLAVYGAPIASQAIRTCMLSANCLGELTVLTSEFSGASAGQVFFTTSTAFAGKTVLMHGEEVIGVIDDLGNVFKPLPGRVDDAGRPLVQSADGSIGILDDTNTFVTNIANRTFDFTSSGTGNDLRRFTTLDGTDVRINSGHAYNRNHAGGDVSQIGTMDEIENAILQDISENSWLGGLEPRTTQTHTVQVNGQIVGYSLADTPVGANINYYPVIE